METLSAVLDCTEMRPIWRILRLDANSLAGLRRFLPDPAALDFSPELSRHFF
jgi:hypothetical protein